MPVKLLTVSFREHCLRNLVKEVYQHILRIVIYWYNNQTTCKMWEAVHLIEFKVINYVRQGGILSCYLLNLYVDKLNKQL